MSEAIMEWPVQKKFIKWQDAIVARLVQSGMEEWQADCKIEAPGIVEIQQKFLSGASVEEMFEILK